MPTAGKHKTRKMAGKPAKRWITVGKKTVDKWYHQTLW
jgi:hypothetical protein